MIMADKWGQQRDFLDKMETRGAIGVESEIFNATTYLIKDGCVVIATPSNGKLALDISNVKDFCTELIEVCEEWKNAKPNKSRMRSRSRATKTD